AAQLIGEYGDLETLLKRTGEIKQEKRRQSLIEHAENARLSKKLVTLDQKVKLDVPVSELAVHDPDYRNLIAFLKAMEFSTLTRRVAEKAQIETAEIEADSKRISSGTKKAASLPSPTSLTLTGGKMNQAVAVPDRSKAETSDALTPQALVTARVEAARDAKFDRAKYETVRTLDRLKQWIARAYDAGMV